MQTTKTVTQAQPIMHPLALPKRSLWNPINWQDKFETSQFELLRVLLIAAIIIGGVLQVINVIGNPSTIDDLDTFLIFGVWVITFGLYYLNQRGYIYLAASVFIGLLYLAFVPVSFIPGARNTLLYFSIVPILITMIFFRVRIALVVTSMITISMFILDYLIESASFVDTFYVSQFLIFTASVMVAFVNHIRSIEKLRRKELESANDQLRHSEANLEKRVTERTAELETTRHEIELLYQIGKEMNAAQSIESIMHSVANHLTNPDYNIVLNLFENYDERTATYIEVTAVQTPQTKTFAMPKTRLDTIFVRGWTDEEIFIIENTALDKRIAPEVIAFFQHNQVHALIAARLNLAERTIGILSLSLNYPHQFSVEEYHFMQAVADLVAAAVERARLYEEEVAISQQLRQLDDLKSQFLASMSHELRTPLNAILNFTEFVTLEMLGPINESQKDALTKSLESGRHLLALINDVLDITKIESGKMKLFVEREIDLIPEINQVIATAETMLKDKPTITLIRDIDPHLPSVTGDKRRIRQVLLNLISNACKFTEKGTITFSAKHQPDTILFAIIDTGPGIALEDQQIVFEPFIQTETGLQHAGGTGLGLPITKRLIEAHGGRIWLESAEGEGAAFYVSLPIQSPQTLVLLQTGPLVAKS